MARPKRKTSLTSTIATVDEANVVYIRESKVLKSAEEYDDDDAPSFVLEDAAVFHKDGSTIANMLNVDLEGPYIIRGVVRITEDQRQYLRKSFPKSVCIEIPQSSRYAIGLDDEGTPLVWVHGSAGWYVVKPHPRYASTFSEICEIVRLYYSIQDVYEAALHEAVAGIKLKGTKQLEKLKRRRRPKVFSSLHIDEVLFRYAVRAGDGVVREELIARCDTNAQFLLAQILKDDDFAWEATSFCTWLRDKHPDLQKKLLEEAAKAPTDQPSKATANNVNGGEDVSLRDEDTAMQEAGGLATNLSLRTKPPEAVMMESPRVNGGSHLPTPDIDPSSTDLYERLLTVIEECGDLRLPGARPGLFTVNSWIYNYRSIKTQYYHTMKDVLSSFAPRLIKDLNPRWHIYPFYQDLQREAMNTPAFPTLIHESELLKQLSKRRKTKAISPRENASISGTAIHTSIPPLKRTGGKNFRAPNTGGLRLATSSKKRRVKDIEDEDIEDDRDRKSVKTADCSRASDPDDPSSSSGDSSTDNHTENDDATMKDSVAGQTLGVVVRAEHIPSSSPVGPNGTWTCSEEGCDYVVRAANELKGQDLIQKHFRDHTEQVTKMNLAMSEGIRGHNPISHLLDKIRKLGQEAQTKEEVRIDGKLVPRPIKRQLLA